MNTSWGGQKIKFQSAKQHKTSMAGGAVVAAVVGLLLLGRMSADQAAPVGMIVDSPPQQIAVDQSTLVEDIVLSAYDQSSDGSGQLSLLNEAVAEHPNTPLAYYARALFFAEQGQVNNGLNDFNRAIELNPSFAGAYLDRAHLYVRISHFEMARADYSQALVLNPQLSEVYQYRGYVYYQLGEFSLAVEDYNQAILHHPTSDLYLMRGLAISNRDNTHDGAHLDLYASMRLTSESPAAQAEYMRGVNGQSDRDFAIAAYTEAIRIDPNYAAAYNGRAYMYMYQLNYDAALKDIAIAIALKPGNPIYLDSRCEFYLRAGEWALGLEACAAAEATGWHFSDYMQVLITDARSQLQAR